MFARHTADQSGDCGQSLSLVQAKGRQRPTSWGLWDSTSAPVLGHMTMTRSTIIVHSSQDGGMAVALVMSQPLEGHTHSNEVPVVSVHVCRAEDEQAARAMLTIGAEARTSRIEA